MCIYVLCYAYVSKIAMQHMYATVLYMLYGAATHAPPTRVAQVLTRPPLLSSLPLSLSLTLLFMPLSDQMSIQ